MLAPGSNGEGNAFPAITVLAIRPARNNAVEVTARPASGGPPGNWRWTGGWCLGGIHHASLTGGRFGLFSPAARPLGPGMGGAPGVPAMKLRWMAASFQLPVSLTRMRVARTAWGMGWP